MIGRLPSFCMISIFIFSLLFGFVDIDVIALEDQPLPPWDWRYFQGYIENLDPDDHEDVDLLTVLQITGTDTNTTPPTILGPWAVSWDPDTMKFDAQVDMFNVNYGAGWDIYLANRYGYNVSNGSIRNFPMPYNFTKSIPTPYHIPNGTLGYIPGSFGNITLSIINGTSGEPLDGVSIIIENHWVFNSQETGNGSDENGNIELNGLQMGLDGPFNKIKIFFEKGNFSTKNGEGWEEVTLFEDQDTHYNITLIEDDMVRYYSPAPGSIGLNNERSKFKVRVGFIDDMMESSFDENTTYIEKAGGGHVPVTRFWDQSEKLLEMRPLEDLEFNTTYWLNVTPRVKDIDGNEVLWRTLSSSFTTWPDRPIVKGTVLINGTNETAPPGTEIMIDSTRIELDNGTFETKVREDLDHSIIVFGPSNGLIDEYLYYGNRSDPYVFRSERGDVHKVKGLKVFKHETSSLMLHARDIYKRPIEGVTFTQRITNEQQISDSDGNVLFDEIRVDINTYFKAEYPNYDGSFFSTPPLGKDLMIFNITLLEDPPPFQIVARGYDDYIEVQNGSIIHQDSEFRIDFDLEMNGTYIDQETIKLLDAVGDEVPSRIDKEVGTLKRWRLIPDDRLSFNSNYSLWLSSDLLDSEGNKPLWRDFIFSFRTEKLESATISGKLTFRNETIEDIPVELIHNGAVLGSAITDRSGYYGIHIKMDQRTLYDLKVVANGSHLGLNTSVILVGSLGAGRWINGLNLDLSRVDDRINISYTQDPLSMMKVNGVIFIEFDMPIWFTDLGSLRENFSFGNPPMDLGIEISEDRKNVKLTPIGILDHDKVYSLKISKFQPESYDNELIAVDGSKALVRGEVYDIHTEFKPIDVIMQSPTIDDLEDISVDHDFYIYFTNNTVDKGLIEGKISIREALSSREVGNLTFHWSTTGRSVGISHDDLMPGTDYILELEPGYYGENGAYCRHLYLAFRTVPLPPIFPTFQLPDLFEGDLIPITIFNPRDDPIRIILILLPPTGDNYTTINIIDIIVQSGEERNVHLDLTDVDAGTYRYEYRLSDASGDHIIASYEGVTIVMDRESDDENTNDISPIYLLIPVILGAILLSLFSIRSIRNKRDDKFELYEE